MSVLKVKAKSKEYPIYIEKGFDNLPGAFFKAGLSGRKMLVVTDENVAGLYLAEVKERLLEISGGVSSFVFPAGEEHKNLYTVKNVYKSCMENMLERKSVIVALGGGVCGDLAGFAAATYMRGISFAQVPTTLLSQVDSSVGGKTGVDFQGAKNAVGAFYQPELVYSNVRALKTLPAEQFASGMGEVIKHGLIMDKDYLDFLDKKRKKIRALDEKALIKVVKGSCKIKAAVVGKDEKEQGIREILNFGHTFGHAAESLSGYAIPHGKCVGLGMLAALMLSRIEGFITEDEINKIKELLMFYNIPVKAPEYSPEEIYRQMFYDKKAKNGELTLILLKEAGKAFAAGGVNEKKIMKSIKYIL